VSHRVLIVVGAGPGVSGSVARRFGREGYDVVLIGIDAEGLRQLSVDLRVGGVEVATHTVDITDADAFRTTLTTVGTAAGRIDALHFNPSAFRQKSSMNLTPAELAEDVGLGVGALLTAVQGCRPFMSAGGRVTATGGMAADNPWKEAASLGVQKAGLRNLIHSIDASLSGDGIRAVSVTVRGALAPEGEFTPEKVAEAIWHAAHQDEREWLSEQIYSG